MTIDSKEASEALSEISEIVHRVRQSRIYDLASQIMIMWGILVLAGNLVNWLVPREGGTIWISVNSLGVVGTAVLTTFDHRRTGLHAFDLRVHSRRAR